MRLFPVLLALLVVGCASSPAPVVLSWHGSDAGLTMARAAADEWLEVCHAAIVVEREFGGVPMTETADEPTIGRLGETTYDSDGKVDAVRVWGGAKDEATTMAHELGHALGIVNHAPAGLMASEGVRGPGAFHVTPDDCARLPR